MFNFLKKIRNKDNTPKKGYNLSYDNLAIPEIHIKGEEDKENTTTSSQTVTESCGDSNKSDADDNSQKAGLQQKTTDNDSSKTVSGNQAVNDSNKPHHKKTHVTYDGVAVPEIHFKEK